jgi:hypothetical protein
MVHGCDGRVCINARLRATSGSREEEELGHLVRQCFATWALGRRLGYRVASGTFEPLTRRPAPDIGADDARPSRHDGVRQMAFIGKPTADDGSGRAIAAVARPPQRG